MPKKLSHVDDSGNARMVDVSHKPETVRTASAFGIILMKKDTLELIKQGKMKKGAVLITAQLAGIQAAKRTAELIPLCHPISMQQVEVELTPKPDLPGIEIISRVKTTGQTGAEMEALTAVSVAALTVYDMIKAVEKTAVIREIHLLEKHGGMSGDVVWGEQS
jgi:cyclic pyranopterin phosphate synthase